MMERVKEPLLLLIVLLNKGKTKRSKIESLIVSKVSSAAKRLFLCMKVVAG